MEVSLKTLSNIITKTLPKQKFILDSEVTSVSNRRGHTYLDFKEDNIKIGGLIFNNQNKINDGDKIKCSGRLSYYAPYGKLSFRVESLISKSGMGDLYNDFIKLKKEMEKKGYFKKDHKKQINNLIKKVIILTSSEGAAIQDIYCNLKNNNSNINVKVKDVPVQGVKCPDEVSRMIKKLDNKKTILIITRGGGDYQDLNGFNHPKIVKNIFNFSGIVISAIGHETDTVLSDYVADYSFATPSLVSQFLIDHNNSLLKKYKFQIDSLEDNIKEHLNDNERLYIMYSNQLLEEKYKLEKWLLKLENNSVLNVDIEAGASACLFFNDYSGVVTEINVNLNENSSCELYGLFKSTNERTHVITNVIHKLRNQNSRMSN